MEAKTEIFAALLRSCRMLRMANDVDRARAALDVEQDILGLMHRQGLKLPDVSSPVVRRRNRRSAVTLPDSITATTAGGAV
jgi:hypothetical protein